MAKHYVLTETAVENFRDAKSWSLARWGPALTRQYFEDLHRGAEYIALNLSAVRARDDLTGDSGLGIHPVREHYIVYVAIETKQIAIVALIRQTRDVPNLLKAQAFKIRREIREILNQPR